MNMHDSNTFKNVLKLIEEQVEKNPNSVAVEDGKNKLTYLELWEKAGKLANYLVENHIMPGDVVGVCMERSKELFVSILAIMRSGAVFTLLDNNLPDDRIEYIINDSCMKIMFVNSSSSYDKGNKNVKIVDVTMIDRGHYESDFNNYYCDDNELVYILYTSGSTGRPKGVEIVHRGLENYITWAAEYYCNNEPSNFPLYSSISFDLTITSLFVPLITGGKIIVFSENGIDLIRKVVKCESLDVIKMTPTHMNMLTEHDIKQCHAEKFILGGEALKVNAARNIHSWSNGRIGIYNEYGPTEATVGCMIYQYDPIKDNRECVPIGKAIKKTGIFVLDNNMKPVPFNIPGEIYIAGKGLAKGYHNLQEQTESKFIESPFKAGSLLYKTGDLARVLPGKVIDYIGRIDEQVKIRGYRIELNEIENVLLDNNEIQEAAVVLQNKKNSPKLCAFISVHSTFREKEIRNEMAKKLPSYMIPDHIVCLDKMPITSNGKIDKLKLQDMEIQVTAESSFIQAKTDFSKKLTEIWKELLQVEQVGINDNFFDVGGNSMLIVQLASRIEEQLNVSCPVSELFAYPTILSFEKYKLSKDELLTENEVENEEILGNQDIAIIGIGAKLPSGDDIEEFFDAVSKEENFIQYLPAERKALIQDYVQNEYGHDMEYTKCAYLKDIDCFDSDFFGYSPKEADVMDPNQRLFLETCWRTLEDAGYIGDSLNGTKTGVYVGYSASENDYRRMAYVYNKASMGTAMQGTLPAIIPSRISYMLNLNGPAVSFDTACSSSLVALHYACQDIRRKECEQALVGSVKINLLPVKFGFDIGISSKDNLTKTFDNQANGTVGGEGAIAFLLKPLSKAIKNKDRIYAVIKGSAINQDGKSNGITAPNPLAQTDVIKAAWKNSKIDPNTISYIEAHGTGTKLGDPIEILGIDGAFSKVTSKKQFCAVGSVKSNIGHLDHAAGMAGLLKTVLCMQNKKLLPTANFKYPNESIDFIHSSTYVNKAYRDWNVDNKKLRCAGISAFGLSGTNAHVILEEPPHLKEDNLNDIDASVLTISAKTVEAFERLLNQYSEMLKKIETFEELVKVCNMSNVGRAHYKYRMAVLFTRKQENYFIDLNQYQMLEDFPNVFISEALLEKTGNTNLEVLQQEVVLHEKDLKNGTISIEDFYKKTLHHYVEGCDISFKSIQPSVQKVKIPGYPLKKDHHWVDVPNYTKVWKEVLVESEMDDSTFITNDKNKDYILLVDGDSESEEIVQREFEPFCSIKKIYLDKDDLFLQVMEIEWKKVSHIIFLGNLKNVDMKTCCDAFIKTVNFAARLNDCINVVALTKNAYGVDEYSNTNIASESRVILSLLKTISIEYPMMHCYGFDVDCTTNLLQKIQKIESRSFFNGAIRKGKIYEMKVDYDENDKEQKETDLVINHGVYVVWGGTGNIGRKLASYLSTKYANVHIILVGRKHTFHEGLNAKYINRDKQFAKLKKDNPNIEIMYGDITVEEQVYELIAQIRNKYHKINGMYLCATDGVGGIGNPLRYFDGELFMKQIQPKTKGIGILEKIMRKDEVDYFVLFSSIITSTGCYGDSSYSASNAYIDAYAQKGCPCAKKVITINWPTWTSTVPEEIEKKFESSQIMMPIDDVTAMRQLERIVEYRPSGRYLIGELNMSPIMVANMHKSKMQFTSRVKEEIEARKSVSSKSLEDKSIEISPVKLTGKESGEYTGKEKVIANIFGSVLGYKTIDVYSDFSQLGANSILLVQIQIELEKKNIEVNETDLFKYSSIHTLAKYIENREEKKEVVQVVEKNVKRVFYKNCYYNALFLLLEKHNRCLNAYYANDVFLYHFDDQKIGMETVSFEDETRILNRQGVIVDKRDSIEMSELIEVLQEKKEAIIWIDAFYESIRRDTYQKEHLLHSIIIHKYHQDTDTFVIIDHSLKDNVDYKDYEISRSELEQCLMEARKRKTSDLCDCIFEFNDYEFIKGDNYAQLLMDRWNQTQKQYKEASQAIGKMADHLESIAILNEDLVNELLTEFNEVVRYKAMDVFRIRTLLGEGNLLSEVENVHIEWKKVRNRFQRLMLLKDNYSEFDLKKYANQIRDIEKIENRVLDCLTEFKLEGVS